MSKTPEDMRIKDIHINIGLKLAEGASEMLFDSIVQNLDRCEGVERENVTILNENKLIQVKINGKVFKIDLIEQRPPKK